ncbi:UTP--glucose-1-phosphate uridylyltransferase [Candidatus Neptunochlamydia vexilliferae]|uniref:UGP3-like C-terminal hexapeptide repeats domain-containing protein n=1 Tax=Candidatus Neptunichlamydia vexilliferae TaxID=1651774 RepID=A0ABS0B051_9BACT|nr:UTP--glucose-1-phosphate uridylyltransferase [Candidatus Neptunochlamydia vexilliferae]MBF5059746.1 hypothetical protein [Candidatus Neptunochlamydia vexilliferae]
MNLTICDNSLIERRQKLFSILEALQKAETLEEKISALGVKKTFPWVETLEEEYLVKAAFVCGQEERLESLESLRVLESFYGILKYHYLVLTLLSTEKEEALIPKQVQELGACQSRRFRFSSLEAVPYRGDRGDAEGVKDGDAGAGKNQFLNLFGYTLRPPEGIDIRKEDEVVKKAILEGIKRQGEMAEVYPVGGAADRLELKDEKTEEGLPAARLIFLGKPLLEGVIADLQAREYLHYKFFGKQVTTPIVMMTSHVNRNHAHIRAICAQNKWFGRPEESFRFATQPLVPTFTKQGKWCLQRQGKLLLKPGGHGALWKLLDQEGVFAWLKKLGKKKMLVRQINNPMAAIDYGLLAFLGLGHAQDKAFGFASCPRLVNAHEGMNVVKVQGEEEVLTNVEYCDFEKRGIEDKPFEPGGSHSRFPSNTNILFADIEKIEEVVRKNPNPGLLVNFRKGHHYHSPNHKEPIARLETTMQNIADHFPASESYLTFNKRRKTISTTKRKSTAKGALLETPEGCYYDYMLNAHELLGAYCNMELPSFPDGTTFAKEGPPFLFSYHPALGPLYSIIGKKIRGGTLANGSELQLEIADLNIENLTLEGSLLIDATNIMGHQEEGLLRYSDQTGQCILKNVTVKNEGIDWEEEDHLFWKHEVKRRSALKVVLHGHSQFIAENVTLRGDLTLDVPHGMKMTAKEEKGRVSFIMEPLDGVS